MDQLIRATIRRHEYVLERLRAAVKTLARDLVKVNAKTQRAAATVEGLSIGLHDVAITWPQPWPDTLYGVYPSLQLGDLALGNVHAILKPGTKTTTGCVIRIRAVAVVSGTVGVDVLGVRT